MDSSVFSDPVLAAFRDRNSDVKLQSLHVYDPDAWAALDLIGLDPVQTRACIAKAQRLLGLSGGEILVAANLEREGMTSANHIARMSPRRFADRMQGLLGMAWFRAGSHTKS